MTDRVLKYALYAASYETEGDHKWRLSNVLKAEISFQGTLKMEAVCSSETLVTTCKTTRYLRTTYYVVYVTIKVKKIKLSL
jgi:hypothetical protein